MTEKTFDLTIFGATGFTGKFILTEVLKTAERAFPNAQQPLQVAIAGRSRERLEALVASLPTNNNSIIQPKILIADVKDEESMRAMCRVSKTLIAAAGPFRFLGEAVVKACVEEHCHYVDITGEPEFFEGMQLKYHEQAKQNNVAIVHVCGFDSIPADMGVLYTKQEMERQKNALPSTIEMFFKLHTGNSGFAGHYATFESAVHGFGKAELLRQMRKAANRPQVPKIGATLAVNPKPHWVEKVAAYTIPFFFADPSVVRLSQQLVIQDKDLSSVVSSPPVQFSAYICIPTFKVLATMIMAHEGPSDQQLAETSFSETFFAEGYSKALQERYPNAGELRQVKPDVSIVTSVSGPEPGYVATPKMVVQACYTLLLEQDKVPRGVLTPAVAFGKTDLIKRLEEQGIVFSTVQQASKAIPSPLPPSSSPYQVNEEATLTQTHNAHPDLDKSADIKCTVQPIPTPTPPTPVLSYA
ncbi:hypothetical protein BG004_002714 [Podila humilis]|nr:hypothetical protein BG004_002714 [Podila humilis]